MLVSLPFVFSVIVSWMVLEHEGAALILDQLSLFNGLNFLECIGYQLLIQ